MRGSPPAESRREIVCKKFERGGRGNPPAESRLVSVWERVGGGLGDIQST